MLQEKNKKQQTIDNMFARMSDTNNNKKNQQPNSMEPPVSFATFQRFIANLPEIVSQYYMQNKTTDESSQTFEKEAAKAYYHDFYAKPEIRTMYPFKLKPCPSSIRNKLLQLPGRGGAAGEKQGIHEEASHHHKNNQEHDIFQPITDNKGISFDDYIFPVTYEMFKKHISNYKSLVKNVIKDQYKPKTKEEFKSLYTDKKCYKNTLKLCYKEYYTNPEWRQQYKCEFQDAPRELLTKLLSFGSVGGSKSDDQRNDFIGHSECDNHKGSTVNVPNPLDVANQKAIERFKKRIPSSYDDLVEQSVSELPLTMDQFYDKIRNSRKILKEILKFISKEDNNLYHALLLNDEIRQHILCEYYLLFYVFPLVRGIFEIQLISCPSAVKELLEHVPKITNFLKNDFPVHIITFRKYANYEEILNQIIPIFGCEDKKKRQKMRSDKMICKRLFEEFFVSYYLAPIITRELINCKFENAPEDLRIKLIGGSDGNSSSSNEEENDHHKQQEQHQNIAHTNYLNMKDFIFPVSFETFRKYIDYDQLMDSLIEPLSHGDKKIYEKLRQDEILCQARFNKYFYWFYCEPKIRSLYKFNFDKAPESLREKLLSFAKRKSQENITIPVLEQDDIGTITRIQEQGPQESYTMSRSPTPLDRPLIISNEILQGAKNQEQNNEGHSLIEANITPTEVEMSEGQEEPPFLTLHVTYQADPEDEIEQYAIQSNDDDDEANITPDKLILEEEESQNTDDVPMEPYVVEDKTSNNSEDINQNHNLAIEEDDLPTEPFLIEDTRSNNSEDINQNHNLAIRDVILEEDDVPTDPYLDIHSNDSNSMSLEEIPIEEIIQQPPSPEVHGLQTIEVKSNQVQGEEKSQDDQMMIDTHSNDTDSMSIDETPPEELIQQSPPAEAQDEIEMTMSNQVQEEEINQDYDVTKTTPTEEQSPEEIIQQLPPEETMAQNDLEPIQSNPIQEVEKNQNRYVDAHSILVNKSLNLPTSLETFKSLITNIDDLVSRLAEEFSQTHGQMFLAREMRFNFELELYRLFYLLPEIRNFYEFRIKPCPSRTKNALLQIPNSFDHIDVKLPVSIDIFREFINYNEILDQVIRTYVANDDGGEDYAKARNDESLCNRLFQSFYYSFYLTPIIIRGTFLYKFHNGPADLLMKLHQFAILLITEDVVDGDNQEQVMPASCDNQIRRATPSPVVDCEIANAEVINKGNQIEMSVIPCEGAAATNSENNLLQKEMSPVNCDREVIQQNPIETNNKETHKEIDHSPQPEGVKVTPNTKPPNEQQISLNAKDWIFPVTIDIFKKSINYKEIMDKHLKSLVKGDAKQLEKLRNNEKLCSAQFRRIYYTFYIKPELRNKIKYNFDAAPNELKEKLLSFAIPKIQTTTEQQESNGNKNKDNNGSDEIRNEQRTEALLPMSNKLTKEMGTVNKENDSKVPKKSVVRSKEEGTKAFPPESNELVKEVSTVNKDNASSVLQRTVEVLKSNQVIEEVSTLNKDNESSVPKQTVDEGAKVQRTETLIHKSNKMSQKVCTVNKVNESAVPTSSKQIPKEQRTEAALLPKSNELTNGLITMVKDNESNAATVQRTEILIPKSHELTKQLCPINKQIASDVPKITYQIPIEQSNTTKSSELTKEVMTIINKEIESNVVAKVTVEIPTENEKTTKATKENMNMDTDLDTKLKTQSKKTPLISRNINFPVPIKIFERFVNQTEIVDKIVKRYAQQRKMDYKTLRNDSKFCRTQFQKFYNTFYIKPNLRKLYDVKFNNAPTDLLKKLWGVATIKESTNQTMKSQQQGHETIKRMEDGMQPIKDVILFLPSNLDEYINQRVSDSNLRNLIKENLINDQQTHDTNIFSHDKGTQQQQQQPEEDSVEFAEKLFFQNVSRFHNTKYLISSSFDLKQEIWIAVASLNIDEFLQFTGIYGADLDMYSKSYLLRRFHRHAIEENNWPVNLYIKMTKFVHLMQLKCVQLNEFNLEYISPKLFYWHELMLYTNYDDCVRYDYYKRYRKQISKKTNMQQIRKEYYNRCWCHDQWISQIPRITDQEIIKQVNEIDWSNISQGKKRSQNVCKQNSMENETQNQSSSNVPFRRSQNVFTDSSQSTTTTTQPTPTKSNQLSETPQNDQNQRSSNVSFRKISQTIFTDSSQSSTTPPTLTQVSETQENELNLRLSSNVFRGSQTIFTDSSQSTAATTQPTPTKSNQISERQLLQDSLRKKLQKILPRTQIFETQLLPDDSPRKNLEKIVPGTEIPETQLLESQKTLEKTTTCQSNELYYDHTYGIHGGESLPPVGLGRECTQNFVDVDNVAYTQSQGFGNNLSVANEHDPLMSASLNVQEIPITKEIKMEKLSPLHDILFLLDSEGSNYTCQPLPTNVIEIVDHELSLSNDLRLLLSAGDSNESTIACSKKPPEATISELNYDILNEEILQSEKIVPDADIEISVTDSAIASSITTSANLQESTNLNHALLCCSSEEIVPTIANKETANNDVNLKPPSSTSTKTVMARQIAKERRPPDGNQKFKRQKTQHPEPIGQLRHEYRALPLCPMQSAITNTTETQAQSVPQDTPQVSNEINAESGEKPITISQAFTIDNTLFNSTELQNVLAQHTVQLTSDRKKMLKQNNVPPFVTIRKKVIINSNSIEDNLIIQQPLIKEPLTITNIHIYRHLIQFHYVNSLNESDIVKYGLLSNGLGQPYQQAVINIDGKNKCKVYGSLVPSLFSNCSESLHKDFQFILNDLKKFHYNLFEKKNVVGGHEDDYDIRKRVLKHFIKSAPIFSNFLLEHQSERFKSGRCLPFERTTLERHSKLNNRKGNNPFLIAIKPHILERMAQLNSQLKM